MKIVFYNETLLSGGIEKCIELLNNYLVKEHDLEIVYVDDSKLDDKVVNILNKNANVHKLGEDEIVEANNNLDQESLTIEYINKKGKVLKTTQIDKSGSIKKE